MKPRPSGAGRYREAGSANPPVPLQNLRPFRCAHNPSTSSVLRTQVHRVRRTYREAGLTNAMEPFASSATYRVPFPTQSYRYRYDLRRIRYTIPASPSPGHASPTLFEGHLMNTYQYVTTPQDLAAVHWHNPCDPPVSYRTHLLLHTSCSSCPSWFSFIRN